MQRQRRDGRSSRLLSWLRSLDKRSSETQADAILPPGSSSLPKDGSNPFPPVASLQRSSTHAQTSTSMVPNAVSTIASSMPTFPNANHLSLGQRPVAPSTSFFPGASGFTVQDFNINLASPLPPSSDGWALLMRNVALSALHDSSARFDPPKCDEDTRVEVTSEIMDWMSDSDNPIRLLVMTGAAGSGKSALQQTIAERCEGSNILGSAFFFSSADPTRNTLSTLVPTMAYQIGRHSPRLKALIAAAVEADPLIFSRSLRTQLSALIDYPFIRLRERAEVDLCSIPYAILIDGLDECQGEDRQAELLSAIDESLVKTELPFRIFIASRPEWAIHSALQPGGFLRQKAYHIQLSDNYNVTGDIRRYLWRRLCYIGSRSRDPRARTPSWPLEEDIENLVRAASGRFIYAATVVRFISERGFSPVDRLRTAIDWTPHEGQPSQPFESLDNLYTIILTNAKNQYQAVDAHRGDFLLLFRAYQINASSGFPTKDRAPAFFPIDDMTALLGLEKGAENELIADLQSLVTFRVGERGESSLHFYHQSFLNFLEMEARAKGMFVPTVRVQNHLAMCCLQNIAQCSSQLETDKWEDLSESRRNLLDTALRHLPYFLQYADAISNELIDFTSRGGWHTIDRLLEALDISERWPDSHEWIRAFLGVTSDLEEMGLEPEAVAVMNQFVQRWMSKI